MKHTKSLMQKVRRGEGGFTLIELLIVILILGILAAVVILNVGGFIGMGEKEAFCTEGDTVQAAAMAWAVSNNGTCPGDTGTLVTDGFLARTPKYKWSITDCVVKNTDPGPDGIAYPGGCGPAP